ncbi:hypothetical protein [Sphingomonas sp. J315]|uniref:hypothetical protein n=1 Tax=Sphingomonas sp. J315 TaxID=2898433 RepID=UPI0021AE2778|nr:hypothetical protein [Sphingomonas sp. J315]UUY01530.1 hypothetical protein LRS08_07100 [Sphingomonas sp. J315]
MRSILIALPLLIAAPAWAQGDDSELWLTATGEVAVADKTSIELRIDQPLQRRFGRTV